MKKTVEGLVIGLVVGILDVICFKFILGFPVTNINALLAITFWTAAGYFIHNIELSIPNVVKGILFALGMGVPWLLDAVSRGKPEETPVLAGIFIVFGAITGLLSGRDYLKSLDSSQAPSS